MSTVHEPDHAAFDLRIDVQVSQLRHKLEGDPKGPHLNQAARNGGYIFATKATRK